MADETPQCHSDPFDLQRFVAAQAAVYAQVIAELRAGRKRTHWMWFIFPQLRGLGSSPTALHYAISSIEESRAYLAHPILGPRLIECTQLVTSIAGRSSSDTIDEIFGYPDNLKFHSCMTLFANAAPDNGDFQQALQKYFGGKLDHLTIDRL
ncbi:MAG: DUF1810 domain-containing protein [Acidobacteria bacterium]|nr:DUF1810 domain-containing protein [Acidobacteriota bacterium]